MTCTHGRIRKRALLTTRGKRASRWAALQPMNWSRGANLPGAGGKPQHGEHLRPAEHQIAQLCSRQRGVAEVMVAVHVLAPERRFGALGDRAQVQFGQPLDAAGDRQLGLCLRRAAAPQAAVVAGLLWWG